MPWRLSFWPSAVPNPANTHVASGHEFLWGGDDFEQSRRNGLNALRLDLSSSRASQLETLRACRTAGLEPVVTLDPGAELTQAAVDDYLASVRETVLSLLTELRRDHLGQGGPPRFFITVDRLNEKGFSRLPQFLEAHLRARRLIRTLYREHDPLGPRPMTGFIHRCRDLYWRDQAWLDLLFAHHRGVKRNELFAYLRQQARVFDIGLRRGFFRRWLTQGRSLDGNWDRLIGLIYESPAVPADFLALDGGEALGFHVRCLDRFNLPLLLVEKATPPERLAEVRRLKKAGWPLIGYIGNPGAEEVAAARLDFVRPDPDLFPRP